MFGKIIIQSFQHHANITETPSRHHQNIIILPSSSPANNAWHYHHISSILYPIRIGYRPVHLAWYHAQNIPILPHNSHTTNPIDPPSYLHRKDSIFYTSSIITILLEEYTHILVFPSHNRTYFQPFVIPWYHVRKNPSYHHFNTMQTSLRHHQYIIILPPLS